MSAIFSLIEHVESRSYHGKDLGWTLASPVCCPLSQSLHCLAVWYIPEVRQSEIGLTFVQKTKWKKSKGKKKFSRKRCVYDNFKCIQISFCGMYRELCLTQHLFLKYFPPHLHFEIHNRQTVHLSPDFPPRHLIVSAGFTVFKFDNILELRYNWLVRDYTIYLWLNLLRSYEVNPTFASLTRPIISLW